MARPVLTRSLRDVLAGPVEAAFWVFDDFSNRRESNSGPSVCVGSSRSEETGARISAVAANYKSGVYHRTHNATFSGGHAIKIVGWGTSTDGTDYWTVAVRA